MKINTKGHYGVRGLFDIAFHGRSMPTRIKDIARRQELSAGYLEQIFRDLKDAGLLLTKRGAQGGYCLTKSPEDISLLDILQATGTELDLVDCTRREEKKDTCSFDARCACQIHWRRASNHLQEYFAAVTLKDLCDQAKQLGIGRELHHFTFQI